MAKNILVNVNRCVGCWTCSLSCKQAYGLADDEYRVFVRTVAPVFVAVILFSSIASVLGWIKI